MSLASKRLVGPTQLTNAAATVYTTPAGTQTTVKYVNVCNTTAVAHAFTMSVGADAAGTRLFSSYSIAANSVLPLFMNVNLAAAETIQANADANSSLTLTINGTELSVP